MSSGSTRLSGSGSYRRRLRRVLALGALGLLLGLGAYLLYLLPYEDMPGWVERVGERVALLGWYGPLAFALVTALMTAVGMPRLLMTAVAAALFGFTWGLISSQFGALAGAYVTFVLARWSGRESGLARWPRLQRFTGLLSEQGIIPVLLIRQLPLSSFFINLLLGLTAVRTRDFIIGSLIGFLPEAIPAALIGAGLVQGSFAEMLKYLLVGLLLFVVLGFLLSWLLRSPQLRSERQRIEMEAENLQADHMDDLP